ncbi:MAG: hypothetical protein ABL963_06400 [Longimicrobiales bacterium]
MPRFLTATVLSALLAIPVSAQVAWDSPALLSPTVPSGFSIFLVEPAGGDLGAMGTLRHSAGPVGMGYRAMVAEESGPAGDVAVSGGVDISGIMARGVEGSEVDVMWWAGGGLSVGSDWIVSAPAGIILGWSGAGDNVIFSPYGGAHVVLDLSGNDGDAVNFDGVVDLGLDLVLSSGWMIRAGASIGDRESIAVGVKIPGGS